MNICVVGSGYVGLVTGTCFAEMGHNVVCVDIDKKKIDNLKKAIVPIYEPGLEELVKKNIKSGRLSFSTSLEEGVKNSLFVFIAVGTPPDEDGSADLKHVLAVAKSAAQFMDGFRVFVNKSTVPVGTATRVASVIKETLAGRNANHDFDVVSNPEFLKEGDAISDFMRPDRIVVGADNPRTAELMKELYAPFVRNGHPILIMDVRSSELTKYAANAMLATRISFMNEVSQLCEKVGADIQEVRRGIGTDKRIGMPFLYAGLGYGGSCFPKDVKALQKTMNEYGVGAHLIQAVEEVNAIQRKRFADRIVAYYKGDLKGKHFGIWGLSFKPKTDDMREAPSIDIIGRLMKEGASVTAFDPEAMHNAKAYLPEGVRFAKDLYEAANQADALVLVTEWNDFRSPDFDKLGKTMKSKVVFDGRNQFDQHKMAAAGWNYFSIGRSS